MDDWHLERARQERVMAINARTREATLAHEGMLKLLVAACPNRGAGGCISLGCDLQPECLGSKRIGTLASLVNGLKGGGRQALAISTTS